MYTSSCASTPMQSSYCLVLVIILPLVHFLELLPFASFDQQPSRPSAPPTTSLSNFSWTHVASLQEIANKTQPVTPYFWHLPKSGGTSLKRLDICLQLVVADEHGRRSRKHPSLEIKTVGAATYVNVDANSPAGLQAAHALGFASQQPAQVVHSTYIPEAIRYLFDDEHEAAVFALFRHPIHLQVSRFYYLQHATWEPTYSPEFQNMTLAEYARYHAQDNNVIRRFHGILEHEEEPVTREHLDEVKRFLKEHVIVGLTEEMDESVTRFAKLFGWDTRPKWNKCHQRADIGQNRYEHPDLQPGDEAWELLAHKTIYDLELFDHAQELFEAQRFMFRLQ